MKKLIIILILFLAFSAHAADEALVVPFTFENGQVADAEQMNENFQAIQEHINKRLVVMSDYGTPEGVDKVFEQSASPTTLTSVIEADLGDGNYEQEWAFSDDSRKVYKFADGVGGKYITGRREYNTSGVMTQDLTYFPAILSEDITDPLFNGMSWGDAYMAKKPDGRIYGIESMTYTALGLNQTVTVPAGTFENCTKIRTDNGNYISFAFYCAGVGLVKRFGVEGLLELQSMD